MLKTLLDKATKKINVDQEKKLKPVCHQFVDYIISKEHGEKPSKIKENVQ